MKRIRTFLIVFMTTFSFGLYPQALKSGIFTSRHFEEPHDVRRELGDYFLSSAYVGRKSPQRIIFSEAIHRNTEYRVIETADHFYQVIVPEYNGLFPLYSKGTYILKRDIQDGSYIQFKVFLKTDESCYARVFPRNDRSVLQVYLYNRKIGDDIIIPLSFTESLLVPFIELTRLASNKIAWNMVWPEYDPLNGSVSRMADTIASYLPALPDADDGGINSDGIYVYIQTGERQSESGLNCSGFVKWIADGISCKNTGKLLDIEELKKKHPLLRGTPFSLKFEDDRDPYFGLDWIRNIAAALSGSGYKSSDVTDVPYHLYTEDIGFRINDLESILYFLAVDRPGYFYLGSVNLDFGTEPVLRQHVHVLALFPYLTHGGVLSVRVMERNRETSLASLRKRYPDAFIHLVRVDSDSDFVPFNIVTSLE